MREPQHIIHQSYGDYEARNSLDNSIWLMIGGVLLIIFGLGGIITLHIVGGIICIVIGVLCFYFGNWGRKKMGEHYRKVNNAPIQRISYN